MRSALLFALAALYSCTPLKSSPHDEKHQLELTLHEVQTNLDDLRHDINCFQTELQILDGRIKYNENALASMKTQDLEKQLTRIDQLKDQVQSLEKRCSSQEKTREHASKELNQLNSHAQETAAALLQFKERLNELERELANGQRKFEELSKLNGNIDTLVKSLRSSESMTTYRVKRGDSLEKIANHFHTTVDKIKKINNLNNDLIVIDQELKIPAD